MIYISDGPSRQKRTAVRSIRSVPYRSKGPSSTIQKQIVGVLEYNLPAMSVVEACLKLYEALLYWMHSFDLVLYCKQLDLAVFPT